QAQLPPARGLRRPPLAPLRRDRRHVTPHPARFAAAALLALALAGCARPALHATPQPEPPMPERSTLRVATYNVSLYDEDAGGLVRRLELGDSRARRIAAVLQKLRPDVVLLNEFDHDA